MNKCQAGHDAVQELEFFMKCGMPMPAFVAWFGRLSPKGQRLVREYITGKFKEAIQLSNDMAEIGHKAIATFVEGFAGEQGR